MSAHEISAILKSMENMTEFAELEISVSEKTIHASLNMPKKRVKLCGYELGYIGIAMILGAFLGFLAENLGRLIMQGVIDSRYMFLPFIAPYSLAVFAIFAVLGNPNAVRFFGIKFFKRNSITIKQKIISNLIYLGIILFFVFAGELVVGVLYEKLTGVSLWDYSNMPLNFTKYTSLPTTLLYGGGAYLLMKFGFIPFMNLLQRKMNYTAAKIIDFTLGSLIIIDCVVMMIIMFATKNAPIHWSVKVW